jgi:hypothetical protein
MVTIGIPTYNRLHVVKIMAESLYISGIQSPHNLRIYDDCSSEFNIKELREIFPTAASIVRNTHNLKADKNIHKMYCDFLLSSDEYFFNADSDLVFRPRWLDTALELIQKTEGVLSIYNSTFHRSNGVLDENLCIKKNIGSAGTLFTRKRVEELISHFADTDDLNSFDWRWSEYFSRRNVPIYCTNASLVQHIGYHGQNYLSGFFDYGKNFIVENIETGQTINDIFELFLSTNRERHDKLMKRIDKNPFLRLVRKLYKKLIDKYS